MPWNPSRLASSLHRVGRTRGSDPSPVQPPRVVENPGITAKDTWHLQVRQSREVSTYLETGGAQIPATHLTTLKDTTTRYLQDLGAIPDSPSTTFDERLAALINEHAVDSSTRDVAVIASVHALSKPAAIQHLSSLFDLAVSRYLRCILLCQYVNPQVVSRQELRIVQCLLLLLSSSDLQHFQQFIEILASDCEPMPCIPLGIMQKALSISGIGHRLKQQLESDLANHQYEHVSHLFSWLQYLPRISEQGDALAVLDEFFPAWSWLMIWRPNGDRVRRWQNSNFTETQRSRISKAFALDGPDIATHKEETLKLAVPHCFEHLNVEPQTTVMLEKFLDLLHKATVAGPSAIDLFIYLCIDQTPNNGSFQMLDNAIKEMDYSCGSCSGLLLTLQAVQSHSQSNLTTQMSSLTKSLSTFGGPKPHLGSNFSPTPLSKHLDNIIRAAQEEFCAELEIGTGDYMGMLIYDLGKAILQVPSLHPGISPEILSRIQNFPSQNVLEAIFDHLEDEEESTEDANTRFKPYLASVLGGKGTQSGPVALSTIEHEVKFWKHRPDSARKGLAKTLAKFQSIDYALYASTLLVMLKEDDLFIIHMKNKITLDNEDCCLDFAVYLSQRRRLNQLQHECWLLILVSLIREYGPSLLQRMAKRMPVREWMKASFELTHLVTPVLSKLPQTGPGMTQELISWWKTLSENETGMKYLLERQKQQGTLAWLYFPDSVSQLREFLQFLKQGLNRKPVNHQILSYLALEGSNITSVWECIKAVRAASRRGHAVVERILDRMGEHLLWSESALALVLRNWRRNESLSLKDRNALDTVNALLELPNNPQSASNSVSTSAANALESEYNVLLDKARDLERLRLRFHRKEAQNLSTLLQRLGIENSGGGRASDGDIPPELVDSVSVVGEEEYELCFSLTGVNELQRQARGIPNDARLLLVRVSYQRGPKFCIHFSPNDEGGPVHTFWRPNTNQDIPSKICTTKSTLFTYYLAKILGKLSNQMSLQPLHSNILRSIASSPANCVLCGKPMSLKRWKPAACSKNCSIGFRTAPLEVRLHNLLVDPLTIDLLLTCVYASAADPLNTKLLPGCPVATSTLQLVIDSFPPLANLQTAQDLRAAIQGHDAYGKARVDLISWLCLSFRGFILTAPDGFRIPSMPNTIQFLLLNSHYEREKLFQQQRTAFGGSTGPVFHGTKIARLFLILSQGIKSMSNTTFMAHGASSGAGIYCADEQLKSKPYAGSTGQSWRHSALSNMNVMLGCELAGHTPNPVHIISNHDQLLVRYVFLLPPGYTPPPRRHVDQAMSTAFAKLHSGTLT